MNGSRARVGESTEFDRGRGALSGLLLSVALLAACHSKEQRASCAAQTAELKTWMQELDAEGSGGEVRGLPSGMKLVKLDERAGDLLDVPTLVVSGARVLIDGIPSGTLADPEACARDMKQIKGKKEDLWRMTHPGKDLPDVPYLAAVGADEPWSNVAALVDVAARAGIARMTFVFEGKNALTEPPAKVIPAWCRQPMSGAAVDPSQKAGVLSSAPSGNSTYANCPDVGKELGQLSGMVVDPDQKRAFVTEHLPRAIEACGCNVDMNEVKADRWCTYGRYSGTPKVGHTLDIAPRGDTGAMELAEPASEPWSQAHALVVSTSAGGHKRVRFEVR